jgi:hypothetical protein
LNRCRQLTAGLVEGATPDIAEPVRRYAVDDRRVCGDAEEIVLAEKYSGTLSCVM